MYVSIDIETLGLKPEYCDIIEFGAVIDNLRDPIEDLPKYHVFLRPPQRKIKGKTHGARFYRGEPFAMAMHAEKLKWIANEEKGYTYLESEELGAHFAKWLIKNGYKSQFSWQESVKIIAAGKNFASFDWRFLRRLLNFECYVNIHHRVHDCGPMYFNPKVDATSPGLEECLKRAGIEKSVEHSAVADAIDVIRCLRHKWLA